MTNTEIKVGDKVFHRGSYPCQIIEVLELSKNNTKAKIIYVNGRPWSDGYRALVGCTRWVGTHLLRKAA